MNAQNNSNNKLKMENVVTKNLKYESFNIYLTVLSLIFAFFIINYINSNKRISLQNTSL